MSSKTIRWLAAALTAVAGLSFLALALTVYFTSRREALGLAHAASLALAVLAGLAFAAAAPLDRRKDRGHARLTWAGSALSVAACAMLAAALVAEVELRAGGHLDLNADFKLGDPAPPFNGAHFLVYLLIVLPLMIGPLALSLAAAVAGFFALVEVCLIHLFRFEAPQGAAQPARQRRKQERGDAPDPPGNDA